MAAMEDDETQQFSLRWHNHQSSVVGALGEMLSSGALSDVTLCAADGGAALRAHRVVLAAASQYFAEIFKARGGVRVGMRGVWGVRCGWRAGGGGGVRGGGAAPAADVHVHGRGDGGARAAAGATGVGADAAGLRPHRHREYPRRLGVGTSKPREAGERARVGVRGRNGGRQRPGPPVRAGAGERAGKRGRRGQNVRGAAGEPERDGCRERQGQTEQAGPDRAEPVHHAQARHDAFAGPGDERGARLDVRRVRQAAQQPLQPARAHGHARRPPARVPRLPARLPLARRAAQARRLPPRARARAHPSTHRHSRARQALVTGGHWGNLFSRLECRSGRRLTFDRSDVRARAPGLDRGRTTEESKIVADVVSASLSQT